MSVRRALVDCVVLSLQDTCVFYPCCKDCFSRIDAEEHRSNRFRCSRCGYRCVRDQVEYRYRLSLKVNRDTSIFGVTVFGNSLSQFFGSPASGLQRLVENGDKPTEQQRRSELLVKAVEDCFIGRHFIFGIKLSGTGSGPLFPLPVSRGRHTEQFIASQMILPTAQGLAGCSVVSYYQSLLQKTSEVESRSADPGKSSRCPATTLLHIPDRSPTSSTSTLCDWSPLSQSHLRSPEHRDCSLSPTPPWQQSLGLVTSSAETEGGFGSQDSEHGSGRHADISAAPRGAQEGFLENHNANEEETSVFSFEPSFYNSPLLDRCPNSSDEKVANGPSVSTWVDHSEPDGRTYSHKPKEFSPEQHRGTLLSSSLAWEDLPFSESLSEFLCEEQNGFDVGESEPKPIIPSPKQTSETFLKVTNIATESTSACQANIQTHLSHPAILLDITNVSGADGDGCHDLFNQLCNGHFKSTRRETSKTCSCKSSQEDDNVSHSFPNQEEQVEEDTYDCSADLFTDSGVNSNTERFNTSPETQRTVAEGCTPLFKTDWLHLRSEHTDAAYLTPHRPNLKRKQPSNRGGLIPQEGPDLDFVPPSQSTPIVKVDVVTQSPASSHMNLTGESVKESLMWSLKPNRRRNRFTLGRRRTHLHAEHPLRPERRTPDVASTRMTSCKSDSRVSDAAVDQGDDEAVVAPTPLALTGKRQTDISSRDLDSTWTGCRGDGVTCERALWRRTPTLPRRGLARTEHAASELSLAESKDSHFTDENQTCDWSRDLFSDSVSY